MNCTDPSPSPEELYEEALSQGDIKRASHIAYTYGVDTENLSNFADDDDLWQWQCFR